MAASISSAAVASVTRATTMVAPPPFSGLKSVSAFPATRKLDADITSLASNGGRVQCMKVWPPLGLKKFETLSYLPPLSVPALLKQTEYLIRQGLIPCIEFSVGEGFVYRENNRSPGYYDGRYWTMWKLPMFGTTDASQVLREVEECKKEYPEAFIRIIGFDNKRQVQIISFIVHRAPGF
ncbi:ribulose-bisphosphate carboxylase [Sarracenia purpurea var. burkii]